MNRSQGGSVLLTVLVTLSSVVFIGIYILQLSFEQKKSAILEYKKVISRFEVDNTAKIASVLTQNQLRQDPNMTSAALQTYLNSELPTYIQTSHEIKNFSIDVDPTPYGAPILSGPFKGMDADNRRYRFSCIVGPVGSSLGQEGVHIENIASGIPITQFTFFGMNSLSFWIGYQAWKLSGRIHVNNTTMISGTNLDGKINGSITTAGYFANGRIWDTTNPWETQIGLAPAYTTYVNYKTTALQGCTNCDGTGLDWPAYSFNRWAGQYQDSNHGVSELTIRTAEPPTAQHSSQRFIIEPVRTTDNMSRYEKFAYKADIRIINGVWYLKNPADPEDWPGKPVWSDHPGSFSTWNDDNIERASQNVGQADIATAVATSPNNWTTNGMPIRFSYYGFDSATNDLKATTSAVVSYGNIFRVASASPTWKPGHYPSSGLCNTNETCLEESTNTVSDAIANISCKDNSTFVVTSRFNRNAFLLNGTRGGFRNGVMQQVAYGHQVKSKVWPMNFDVNAFADALKCNAGDSRGEIGCYFGAGNYMGRPFNGIVYVMNTWNGQNRMSPVSFPQRSPYFQADTEVVQTFTEGGGPVQFPGTNTDADQPTSHAAAQQILPMQLCSTSLAGQVFNGGQFKIPDCSKYKNHTTFRSRINALRVINARNIDSTVFPKGLTIATNIQMYSVGDVNSSSDTSSSTSTPWLPVLLAGDWFIPLSNGWTESGSRWDAKTQDTVAGRTAANTRIVAAVSPHVNYFNEKWSGKTYDKQGPSIDFDGSTTSYVSTGAFVNYGNETYANPNVITNLEDPHLRLIANQPPGVPYVSVFTVNSWISREMSNAQH